MNDDQRAVLVAIARMEGRPGTLIDEYTVAREAGLLAADLAGHEYVAAPGREAIRRHFGELEGAGLIRLDRDGFWRPRTTLAGRRVLQGIPPLVAPLRANDFPEWSDPQVTPLGATERTKIPSILGDDDDDFAASARGDERGWPAWWPAALRVGDPSLTPLLVPIAGIVVLLICVLIGARALGGRNATPTPTPTAVVAAAPTPGPGGVAGGGPGVSPSGATNGSNAPAAAPTPTPTRTPPPKPDQPPTPTAKPQSKRVIIAHTDNLGAALYATPKGERKTLAIPEGIIVEVIGPDERDSTGANWKHVRWADGDYWLPEEYTEPAG